MGWDVAPSNSWQLTDSTPYFQCTAVLRTAAHREATIRVEVGVCLAQSSKTTVLLPLTMTRSLSTDRSALASTSLSRSLPFLIMSRTLSLCEILVTSCTRHNR